MEKVIKKTRKSKKLGKQCPVKQKISSYSIKFKLKE
jgi:hypothetical protein